MLDKVANTQFYLVVVVSIHTGLFRSIIAENAALSMGICVTTDQHSCSSSSRVDEHVCVCCCRWRLKIYIRGVFRSD